MKNKKYLLAVLALGIAVAGVSTTNLAQATTSNMPSGNSYGFWSKAGGNGMHAGMKPGIRGSVTAVSGNTITVSSTGRKAGANSTTTVYAVDATNAKIMKNGTASSVSAIAVGDTVMVQGTISGNSVTATVILDGMPQNSLSSFTSNGQPIIGGAVTAINGETITITNKSNVTYAIDATSAKIIKIGVTSPTISNIAVGDNLIIQGTINGASIQASSIIDRPANVSTGNNNPTQEQNHPGFFRNVWNSIIHFF